MVSSSGFEALRSWECLIFSHRTSISISRFVRSWEGGSSGLPRNYML